MGVSGEDAATNRISFFKHEDIDRHHLHIVTVRVDENGRGIDTRNNFYRSKQITRELERKYGLHDAERKNRRLDTPLHKVDTSAGDVKKQVGNIVKAISGQYRFQTMGEYCALLFLIYNMTVEEVHGNVRGREYHGLVYSATDDKGNKVGNPFKSSQFGKSVGYEAVLKSGYPVPSRILRTGNRRHDETHHPFRAGRHV